MIVTRRGWRPIIYNRKLFISDATDALTANQQQNFSVRLQREADLSLASPDGNPFFRY
jgi:hypothetical protein